MVGGVAGVLAAGALADAQVVDAPAGALAGTGAGARPDVVVQADAQKVAVQVGVPADAAGVGALDG